MIIDIIKLAVDDIDEYDRPFYSYGTWNEEANRVTYLNRMTTGRGNEFPLVFLLLPMQESYISSENSFESTIKLYILNTTEIDYTPQERHNLEMPIIRELESTLLTKLKNFNIKYTDYEREEFIYNENVLNTPVNAIELEIPAIYQLNCLT